VIYTLIPLCLIFFLKWQLEKHENKALQKQIKMLELVNKLLKEEDLSASGLKDKNGIPYREKRDK
jgi:hypothetical protein